MSYYKNVEIAREYNVSSTTVGYWIENALNEKNNLQVEKVDKKFRVVKSEHNRSVMFQLQDEGLKHKSSSSFTRIQPSEKFFSIFNHKEIVEIINNLKVRHEIPLKFTYYDIGADLWNQASNDQVYITKSRTESLLEESFYNLEYKTRSYSKINIVDVGPGNGIPLKYLLERFNEKGKLNKYTAIDISTGIIKLSVENVKSWFPKLNIQSATCDVEKDDFAEALFHNKQSDSEINVVFFVGDQYGNMIDRLEVLRNIRESLDEVDVVVISNKLESEPAKTQFNHLVNNKAFMESLFWIPKELGLDISQLEYFAKYDSRQSSRLIGFKMNKEYEISFTINNTTKVAKLYKDQELILWRHHMSSVDSLYNEVKDSDMSVIQLLTERNRSHILVVAETADHNR